MSDRAPSPPDKPRSSTPHSVAAATDWVRLLHLHNEESYEQAQRNGQFRSPMFTFIHAVRLKLPVATEEEAIATIEGALRGWNESIPDPWRHWFPASADPVTEFRETWRKLRTDTLQIAIRRADSLPLKPLIHGSNTTYVRCLSIAFQLQIVRGSEPIFLPCGGIGRVLGVDRKIVWQYRSFACELGLMLRTARSSRRTEADEFRFYVELFDRESGEQLSGATQSCVAAATHEIPGSGSINKSRTQESHEKSCVASATESCVATPTTGPPRKKPANEPYIPSGAETAVILQQHQQWRYGRKT